MFTPALLSCQHRKSQGHAVRMFNHPIENFFFFFWLYLSSDQPAHAASTSGRPKEETDLATLLYSAAVLNQPTAVKPQTHKSSV